MRKKFLFVLAAVLLLPALMWGQGLSTTSTGLTSLQYDFSYGVFWNEMDKAVNVGSDFSTLSNNFLFGGIGNLNKGIAIGTVGSSLGNPVWLGLYKAGSTPWSVFGGFHKLGVAAATSSQTQYIGLNTETVVSGTTTTTYPWYSQVTQTDYSAPWYNEIDDEAQFLIDIGALNLGAYLHVTLTNNTISTANTTVVDTYQYRTSPANTAPVTTAVDYTRTTTATDLSDGAGGPGIDNMIQLGVPVYVKGLEATANILVGYHWLDASITNSQTFTVPQDPATALASPYTNTVQNDTIIRGSEIPVQVNLFKDFGPIFGSHPDNKFTLGAAVNANLMGATYSTANITQDYTFVIAGAATPSTRSEVTDSRAFAGTLGFSGYLTASHSFYVDPAADVHFGVIPGVTAGYLSTPLGVKVNTETAVTRVDGDADGAFTSAADTITTVTTTYTNQMTQQNGTLANASVDNDIVVVCSLPTGFMFQIAPWFGFTLGAQPSLTAVWTFTKTTAATTQVQTVVADGTGTVATTTVATAGSGNVTNQFAATYSVSVPHDLGVRIGVPGNVMLYIDVAGAVSGGIWDFRNLRIQGVIPM